MVSKSSGVGCRLAAVACLVLLSSCQEPLQETKTTAEGAPASEAPVSVSAPDVVPPTVLWDGAYLKEVRDAWRAGDTSNAEEIRRLLEAATQDLGRGPFTIVNKPVLPVSGDPHDYFSMGPYWWPNPDTPDGLPYVRRDGEWNSDNDYDSRELGRVMPSVRRLSLAYYLTGDERYAEKAAELLRIFFLDDDTRMNPHLKHAQAIPGRNDGRAIGMIDTWSLPVMLQGVVLLRESQAWTPEDDEAMRAWVEAFLDWFLYSDFGAQESVARNNHSTWYFAQVGAYGMFVGREDELRALYQQHVPRLITQFDADGRQPLELERTRSLHYSLFNLKAFLDIVRVGEALGLDYANPEQSPGREVLSGVYYMGDYVGDLDAWPYPLMGGGRTDWLWVVFRRAGGTFDDPQCFIWEQESPEGRERDGYWSLVYKGE